MTKPNIYAVGGTVQAEGGLYIPRKADQELLALCSAGTFAYVLTSRQMGKSSLMVRTTERLTTEPIRCVIIDLNQLGVGLTSEQWYLGLLTTIADNLTLQTDVIQWWQSNAHLGITQRLTLFFQNILLVEVTQRVVIFVDEIDSTLSLSFTDDFYAAIRYFYNARAHKADLQRLSFVLIGVATPSDLISDPRRTPFNIGQRVDLTDFTFKEALPLADGLGLPTDEAWQVFHWVMDWTGGHPYLTQRLCRAMIDQDRPDWSKAGVERAVADTFFGEMSEQDHNLQFVRDMLTKRAPDPAAVLTTYREIRLGFRLVRDEEQSIVKSHLKLSGVVRHENGALRVRNPIYTRVFDIQWIKEHLPVNWSKAFYSVGGTVQSSNGVYINRKAENDLLGFCLTGTFAYVLGPCHMGKSSLMVRTAERLAGEGIQSLMIDLAQIGRPVTAEDWYQGLIAMIADQLLLEMDVVKWWQAQAHLDTTERLVRFFQEVVLTEVAKQVVIFVDEIDTTLGLSYTDDFFAAIRSLYDSRVRVPKFQQLSFVLLGVATPGDLIRDPQRTPFNIGQRVDLTDWRFGEALPLAEGLGLPADAAREVLSWVLEWTGGHPYLTQRLCRAITEQGRSNWSQADVDRVVASTFFGEKSKQDHNLQFVRDMLTMQTPDLAGVMTTYREIRRSQRPILDEEQSPVKAYLKLSGVVRRENGALRVRNPIYAEVFDDRWVKGQLPINWAKRLRRMAVGLIAILFVASVLLMLNVWIKARTAPTELVDVMAPVQTVAAPLATVINPVERLIEPLFPAATPGPSPTPPAPSPPP